MGRLNTPMQWLPLLLLTAIAAMLAGVGLAGSVGATSAEAVVDVPVHGGWIKRFGVLVAQCPCA